jgi:cellulose synthase/poly-beta-1,6-N-acetylglucosamine synthase-like glycosyltransferase/peptidoglycan/xylan/chitin deacetylase (PgdA/CDA1 family)/spore germination protein YaaH
MKASPTQIFHDPRGRRRVHMRISGIVLAAVTTILAGTLIISIVINPILPQVDLPSLAAFPHSADTKLKLAGPVTTRAQQRAVQSAKELKRSLRELQSKKQPAVAAQLVAPPAPALPSDNQGARKPLAIGFYVNWDDSSYSSLKRNLGALDWLVPEWIRLRDGDDPLSVDIEPRAVELLRQQRPDLPVLPLVQNYENEKWNSAVLAHAVTDEASRQRLITALTKVVADNRFAGLTIDLEEAPASAQANLLTFMRELHTAFQARGWLVAEAVPFDNPDWDYAGYAAATDYLMLMAYDQHWSDSKPGPISSQDWFDCVLQKRMATLDPAKTIVCIGNYGYNWSSAGGDSPEVSFQEAVLAARDSETEISFDPVSHTPYFEYDEEDGSHHSVWFLDGVTAYNQMRAASAYHPAGFALWRLGSEDPAVWSVFGSAASTQPNVDGLDQIEYGYDIDFEGTGEILQVVAEPHDGKRSVVVDRASGNIVDEKLIETPSGYVIRRSGDRPGLVALTFDDGPDAEWTPKILDLLRAEHVPATFFIIGENGQANPQLVKRIVAEGHDIGNHSYTHPNLGEIPASITTLELNATQRLIESLTGRSTTLFRAPYFGDAEPTTPDEVDPIVRARKMGYLTVGLHVDPDDWQLPGTDEIVQKTVAGVSSDAPNDTGHGQVVLLHDGGGNRQQTLDALPRIIHELRARGYRFVTVSELAGMTQAQTMPPVPENSGFARINAVAFYVLALAGWAIAWLFLGGILLGIGRSVIIGALAWAQRRRAQHREQEHLGAGFQPFVSVIIPAFNEVAVIGKTIQSILASDYPAFEIVVVDDGSTDGTSEAVIERFGSDPRVRLFTCDNAGKATALSFGLSQSRGEIVIGLDADTVFESTTIAHLAARFIDPRIGAVAGNAKVGNRLNLVTRWQALEYITSQNLDRRAFASLNCITVVPGSVGAWRRELVEQAGGFNSDTLAEDQDLTLRIRRMGYQIGYEERAIAWTEAPDTLRGLFKQRFRWAFGTLQCMWKHRDALFRRRYGTLGWIAMPNVWIFQIFFPLVSPLLDALIVWSLITAVLARLEHPADHAFSHLNQVLFYYALFLAIDWLSAAFAFALERGEQWRLLWWLFLQRFGYRQVMYAVMVKSVAAAAKGGLVGWGKLERKDTVAAPVLAEVIGPGGTAKWAESSRQA